MTGFEMAWLSIGTIGLGAAAIAVRKLFRSASLKTGSQRLRGFSVFDLHLTVHGGGAAETPKTEASLYLTLKTTPAEPISAAKRLFEKKVRRLGE